MCALRPHWTRFVSLTTQNGPGLPFPSRLMNKGKDHKGNRNVVPLGRLKNHASFSICPSPLSCLNFPLSNRPYYALRRSSSLMRRTVAGSARLPSAAALGLCGIWRQQMHKFISQIKNADLLVRQIPNAFHQQREAHHVGFHFLSLRAKSQMTTQKYVKLV